MFKKALQIAVTLSLLIGGFAGYTRLFAVVAAFLGDGRMGDSVPFPESDSDSSKRSNELARESFGPGSWQAGKDLPLRYYEAARGYYLYAQHYERLKEGKLLHVWPFAEISVSPDGKNRKTIVSDEAWITLSQPFGVASKPGEDPSHIVHAKLLGNVWIRDDKGTREDPTDDLKVGPMTSVDYDDKTLQITSDSDIILQDRDLRLTGIGMMIQLRRKAPGAEPGGGGSGFDTETAFVYKDVHIVVNNVGANGILPGTAKPEKSGKTPLDLRCDREMKITFPPPEVPVLVGPPDLDRVPDPTFVTFKTNVRVLRGTDKTDQLNCDTLDLTLMPNPRPPVAEPAGGEKDASTTMVATLTDPPGGATDAPAGPGAATTPPSTGGPLTDLKLRKAFARGDAVWLQSEASGLVARCHELHYEKHAEEGEPDVTYLNGGSTSTRKLWVEKVDYDNQAPVPNTIKSIMRLTSIDATIFDFGPGGTSKVIARGPGKMEERPARNASVARTVWFEDEMHLLTWRDGEATMPSAPLDAIRALKSSPAPPPRGTLRRLVTLLGVSKLVDHTSSTTLDAKKSIVAEFQATRGCDLQLMPSANDIADIPSKGKNLVVVAALDRVLHFRVFDADGRMVEDTDETKLTTQAQPIADLKVQLEALKPPHEATTGERVSLVNSVAAIVGQAPGRTLPDPKDGPTEIKWLHAYEDAHLTAPSRTLTARQFLIAKFETKPKPPATAPLPPTAPIAATGPIIASADPTSTPAATPPATAEPVESPLAPPEPAIDGRANRIWANILLGEPNAKDTKGTKGELKDAQLRGSVMVHQEPAPGKTLGNDASGEALDITGQGNGLMRFAVKAEEPPQAFDPKTKLASDSKARRSSPVRVARIEFEGKVIESVDLIGLDQLLDFAWSDGEGTYIQMAARGLLDDKGIDGEKAPGATRPTGPTPQDQLVITWNDRMRFYGRSKDLENRPAAKIEFRGKSKDVRTPDGRNGFRRGVEAKMTHSLILCDSMDVYMDKTIALNKDTRKPAEKSAGEPAPSQAQIAMLDCRGRNLFKDNGDLRLPGVDVINEKFYPDTGEFKEKQRIQGERVIYDKRTGDFEAPGAGTTWLYKRKARDLRLIPSLVDARQIPAEGKELVVVAAVKNVLHFRVFDADGKVDVDTDETKLREKARPIQDLKKQLAGLWPPHELLGNEKDQVIGSVTSIVDQARREVVDPKVPKKLPPLELTKVKYNDGMRGRFGVAQDQANDNQAREAQFLGAAQAANAVVVTKNSDIDFDRPVVSDYMFLTSDDLHVFSEPPPFGSKATTRQLLKARGNAMAKTVETVIQSDLITYDSASENIYAYGENGKEVTLIKQDSKGQPFSNDKAKTVRFNKKTHQGELNDPQAITFTDLKSGLRPKPAFPELGGTPKPPELPKTPRTPLQRPSRSSTERKTFSSNGQ